MRGLPAVIASICLGSFLDWAAASVTTTNTTTALRGYSRSTSILVEEEPASIICHLMELRVEYADHYYLYHNPSNAAASRDFICVTTGPMPISSFGNDKQAAFTIYRIDALVQHFHQLESHMDSHSSEVTWIQISRVRRHESNATIHLLPEASLTAIPAPDYIVHSTISHRRKITITKQRNPSNPKEVANFLL
jgi:hypothetical protein